MGLRCEDKKLTFPFLTFNKKAVIQKCFLYKGRGERVLQKNRYAGRLYMHGHRYTINRKYRSFSLHRFPNPNKLGADRLTIYKF